jgi:hypothetical protein
VLFRYPEIMGKIKHKIGNYQKTGVTISLLIIFNKSLPAAACGYSSAAG